LSVPSSALSLPFFTSERQFEAKWLLEIPASGSIAAQHLTTQKFQATNISAQLQLSAGKLLVHGATADLLDGKFVGDWAFDFSGERPTITSTGSIQRADLEQVNALLEEQLGTGSIDLDYRLTMSGSNVNELASSSTGSGSFNWHNGAIHSVHSDDEQTPALTFSAWSGRFTVAKQHIALQGTKMISVSGVREVSGDVSFNRQWNLRFVRANGSGFVATGSMSNPNISNEPAKLAEAR